VKYIAFQTCMYVCAHQQPTHVLFQSLSLFLHFWVTLAWTRELNYKVDWKRERLDLVTKYHNNQERSRLRYCIWEWRQHKHDLLILMNI
jgi:hypothetical protein